MPDFEGARRSDRHGADHARARARAFKDLPDYSPCARCGGTMWKHALDHRGHSAVHYDHTDDNRGYLGFSHARCNLRAGAAKGGRVVAAKHGGWRGKTPTKRRQAEPPEW